MLFARRLSPFTGGGLAVCLVCLLAAAPASAALDHHVSGDLYAYAHNANAGVPISRDIPAGAATSVADTATQIGPTGNTATASYYANLATGSLGTYIYGHGPQANVYGGGGASLEAHVHMDDRIYVTIPPGTYGQDLYVALHGHVEGVISAAGVDGSRASNGYQVWYFSLGGPLGGDGTFSVRTDNIYPDTSPYVVNEDFTLTARVLYDGTYATERVVTLFVVASLKSKGAALGTYPYGDETTSVLCDFYHTGEFTSLVVPDGCTWESGSGVFIPEPATMGLLAAGALALIRRRRSSLVS